MGAVIKNLLSSRLTTVSRYAIGDAHGTLFSYFKGDRPVAMVTAGPNVSAL